MTRTSGIDPLSPSIWVGVRSGLEPRLRPGRARNGNEFVTEAAAERASSKIATVGGCVKIKVRKFFLVHHAVSSQCFRTRRGGRRDGDDELEKTSQRGEGAAEIIELSD